MLLKQANSFKSLDDLLQTEKDPHTLSQLLDKKTKLLALVQGGQLTADKYLLICKKTMAESTICSEQVKDSTEMEMIGLGDDVGAWFKEVVEETTDKLEDQKKMIAKIGGKVPAGDKPMSKPAQQKMQKPVQKRESTKPTQQPQPQMASSTGINPSQILSLKVLDTLMEQNQQNKALYIGLYQQKQKLLQLIKQKKLNPQLYYQTLDKLVKSSTNEDITCAARMEIEELRDFHGGNLEEWFKDRLESTEEESDKQKNKYSIFKTGKSLTKQSSKNQDMGISIQVDSLANNIAKKANFKPTNPSTKPFCFKYLDDQLEHNQENPKVYIDLFEQKLKCLELIKNQEVTAQDYRSMLGSLAQESTKYQFYDIFSEDLKGAAEMEIDLHDITGDVGQFFESCIEETGGKYEEQQKMYNKFTGGKGQKLNLNAGNTVDRTSKKPQTMPKIQKQPRPDISDIVSFTVLVQFLEKYKKDYDYCTQLKEKGAKLLKLVQDKKLGVPQYLKFLDAKLNSSKDAQIIEVMQKQYKKLSALKDKQQQKQYKTIIGEYLNKTKINLGNRNSYNSQIFINEMTINEAEPKIKIEYLLRKLGKHESLYVFYKNNKMERHLKQFQKVYQTAKKQTLSLCEKIKIKDGNDIGVDLHQFVEKNLPNISFAVLHRESRTAYNQKIEVIVEKIKKSNAKLGQYVKSLKKGVNKNNIEQGLKTIQKNNKTIAYLQSLKNQDFIPFPLIQQTKTQMYNLDLNKNLTQNQIEIKVTNFEGIKDHLTFRIYMIDRKQPRFQANVHDGPQKDINVIMKIPPEIMEDIIKGSSNVKYLSFALVSKGWFSQKYICEAELDLNFIRSNRMEDRLTLKAQRIFMDYIINVLKPKKPLVTEIPIIKVTEYPRYEHNSFVENEFIKTIMPFEKPTQSEIRGE